jgi:hypothetical protein
VLRDRGRLSGDGFIYAGISVRLLRMRLAWIPALLVYYIAIEGAVL